MWVIWIHSVKLCVVAKLCRVNKINKEFAKVRISLTSNCNTFSMWARVGTCISVSTSKSCTLLRKRKCFPFNAAKKIWKKRVLVVIRFNATFLPLKPYCEKMCTSFLNDAESLTSYGCAPWCSQIVYICPYSLNTTTAFYFATECLDVTVFVWGRTHATMLSYITWPWPGLDSVSYSGCSVVPSVTG